VGAGAAVGSQIKTQCCTEYRLVYEDHPKHRVSRYFDRKGRSVARRPQQGAVVLPSSIVVDPDGNRRVGYDAMYGELIVFPLTRRDDVNCVLYYHGWVADFGSDLDGRDTIRNAARQAGFPLP
jgi:hypothetical protein